MPVEESDPTLHFPEGVAASCGPGPAVKGRSTWPIGWLTGCLALGNHMELQGSLMELPRPVTWLQGCFAEGSNFCFFLEVP